VAGSKRIYLARNVCSTKCDAHCQVYWSLIGDRDDEAGSIEEVTNILKFSKEFDLQIFATATKISWAANRKSIKVEDPPCPPFKPFGINMPTIYEAEKAF
jgi:hypothetical protein